METKQPTLLGHPKGLFYLAATEAWERFSYYGMTALVVLYMANQLLLPGHVHHIFGFSGFKAAVESVVGPLSTQALASQIFGLYSGFVYFTPVLGGMIADRWTGQRNAVLIISIFESIAYDQIFNVSSIWIQQHVALDLGGFRIPVPWFQSINSVFSIASVPLLFWIWQQQALRGREPNELAKIGTGAFLAAASNLIPVAAIFLSGASPVHPLWPFLYSAGLGISFLYYWPTLLALVSRAAPAKMNATLMGLAFMSLFIANTLVGWIGGFYEKMTPAHFWALHAAIAAGGGLLVVLFGRRLSRLLRPIRLS